MIAYDDELADRVRHILGPRASEEKNMFGGLAFLFDGNMAVGVLGEDLVARVGPDAEEESLALPGARPMDFTGRPMKGWIFVESGAVSEDDALGSWIDRSLDFVGTLEPK